MLKKSRFSFVLLFLFILIFSSLIFCQKNIYLKKNLNVLPQNSYPVPSTFYFSKHEKTLRQFLQKNPKAIKYNSSIKTISWNFSVGSAKTWYTDNIITDERYPVPSTCRAVGAHCYIFVENTSWNTGRVNQAVVDSIRIYFDQKTPANPNKGIYEMTVDAFGSPPDVDGDPKIIILLLDIKDGYSGSGVFVAGYFYSFNEIDNQIPGFLTSNFAEIYFLDTNPLNLKIQSHLEIGLSTTVHELQHMINFRYDFFHNRLTFINEGCSLAAEVNCGYPIFDQNNYIDKTNRHLFDWSENNFTEVLSDYARAARFFVYLRDQAGMEVFRPMVASISPDEKSIDDGLAAINSPLRFEVLLQNWFISNIIDDRNINPLYGYVYPGLPKAQTEIFLQSSVPSMTKNVESYAVYYLSFKTDSLPRLSFLSSNKSLIIKAIEIGASTKRVLNVAPYVDFREPLVGSVFSEVHFALINMDSKKPLSCIINSSADKYELSQNFPNPFNLTTTIFYALPSQKHVSIRIYNICGEEVATILDKNIEGGHHLAVFAPNNLPSGVYFYCFKTDNFTGAKKMLILK